MSKNVVSCHIFSKWQVLRLEALAAFAEDQHPHQMTNISNSSSQESDLLFSTGPSMHVVYIETCKLHIVK